MNINLNFYPVLVAFIVYLFSPLLPGNNKVYRAFIKIIIYSLFFVVLAINDIESVAQVVMKGDLVNLTSYQALVLCGLMFAFIDIADTMYDTFVNK